MDISAQRIFCQHCIKDTNLNTTVTSEFYSKHALETHVKDYHQQSVKLIQGKSFIFINFLGSTILVVDRNTRGVFDCPKCTAFSTRKPRALQDHYKLDHAQAVTVETLANVEQPQQLFATSLNHHDAIIEVNIIKTFIFFLGLCTV